MLGERLPAWVRKTSNNSMLSSETWSRCSGKRGTVCKAMPAHKELRGQSRIQIDGLVRENAGRRAGRAGAGAEDQLPSSGTRRARPGQRPAI